MITFTKFEENDNDNTYESSRLLWMSEVSALSGRVTYWSGESEVGTGEGTW